MDQLTLQNAGRSIAEFGSRVFAWLEEKATSLYYRIVRWWGGERARIEVWNAYKEARKEVMDGERNNDMRLILLQDLRQEFRLHYPAYADLWN